MVIILENCIFCDIKSFIHAKKDQDKTNGQGVQRCIQNPVKHQTECASTKPFSQKTPFWTFY